MALQGTGKIYDPYLIYTESDLNEVRNNLSANYKQMQDIIMTSPFTPIGTSFAPFTGAYDGQGYKIINLTINITGNTQGMFSNLSQCSIRNMHFVNPIINNNSSSTRYSIGILAGTITNNSYINSIYIEDGAVNPTGVGAFSNFGPFGGTFTSSRISDCLVKGLTSKNTINSGGAFGVVQVGNISRVFAFSDGFTGSSNYKFAYTVSGTTLENCGCMGSNSNYGGYPYGIRRSMEVDDIWKKPEGYNFETGENEVWNVIEGEFPYLTLKTTYRNPTYLYDEFDLYKVNNYPSHYFILANNIKVTIPNITSNGFFNGFRGVLDGDGYEISGINSPSSINNGVNRGYFIKDLSYATIKNISFVIENYQTISDTPIDFIEILNFVSIDNMRIKTLGEVRSTRSGVYRGLYFTGFKSTINDCYIEYNTVGGNSTVGTQLISSNNGQGEIVKTIQVIKSGTSRYFTASSTQEGITLTNCVGYGNFVYDPSTGPTGSSHDNIPIVKEYNDFTNPNNPLYINYTNWRFEQGVDPIQKVFVKVVVKIVTEIVKNYAKSTTFSMTTEKVKNILEKSFTSIISIVSRKGYSSKVKGFSRKFKTTAVKSKIGKVFFMKNFSAPAYSTASKSLFSHLKSYTSTMSTKVINVKNILRIGKYFMKPIDTKIVSRRSILRGVKNYTGRVFSKFSHVKRRYENLMNYSNSIISNVETIRNRFNIITVNVKNYTARISNGIFRQVFKNITLINYSKKIENKIKILAIFPKVIDYFGEATHKIRKVFISSFKKY